MKPSRDLALANAKRLRELNARVSETVKLRSRSPADRAEWELACSNFHAQFGSLFFPGGEAAWESFIRSERSGVEAALVFLEADPRSFRSGYIKQIVWDRLKRSAALSAHELSRLESVADEYLQKPALREFWHMGKFMRLRGSKQFWSRIESLAADPMRQPPAIKASWLLLARANLPIRRRIQSELRHAKYEPTYRPTLDFYQLAA